VRRAIAALAFVLSLFPFSAAAQDQSGQPELSIRFYDQKVYFLGDQIMVEATLTNTGAQMMRFSVADNRYFSFDFDVRTTTNLAIDHARQFITERTSDQPVYFRDVGLQPGEKYSVVMDLTSYASFTDAGLFVVQGEFFPSLWRGKDSQAIKSNRLTLDLRPPVVTEEMRAVVEARTGALLTREPLSPDEVVAYAIQARQKSQWDKFFLYLDLESLMRKNPEKDRAWRRSSQDAQRAMLDQFKQQLMAAKVGQDINVIPSSFQIQKTSYTPSEGTVQVLEKFTYPDYTELKRYTYYLKKQDSVWIIYDYEIKNLGTQ
jgi:hypothetical protein